MKKLFQNTPFQIIAGAAIIILVTWGSVTALSHRSADYSYSVVTVRDITQTVNGNGSVTSDQSVTLSFNMQGRVAWVNARVGSTTYVGQVLASLDTGTLQASLTGAQADVQAAEAKLTRMQNGARPEEQALYIQKYSDASSALISAMKGAYLSMIDATIGKTDSLFTNGNSVNPTLNIRTQSDAEKRSTEQSRVVLRDRLSGLQATLSNLDQTGSSIVATSSLLAARSETKDILDMTKNYIDQLGFITGNLSPGGSGQAQSVIDSERAITTAAAQEVTTAMSAEQSVDAAWSSARDALTLELAGSTAEDVQVAKSALGKAQSVVQGIQSQLRQSYIIAPYEGVVTAVNVKVGEVYVPGMSVSQGIGMIGSGSFKVEVYVPETDVGKTQIDNPVAVTLDAYGPGVVFPGHVIMVDPAATVQNGVNAYRVSVSFDDQKDVRIKSGLTANIIITTKVATAVLAVPSRAIINRGANTIILVKDAASGGYKETTVQTGIVSADGFTEIISQPAGGLNEGDTIAGFGAGR